MNNALSYPVRHISVRVPWHDNRWNGTVCGDPAANSACLKLTNIAQTKDEAVETIHAGRHLKDLEKSQIPPCLEERATFMSQHGLVNNREHPYHKTNEMSHGHFRSTPLNYPAYSAPAIPFRWMMKSAFHGENGPGLGEYFPLNEVSEDLEPELGFKTNWWQDYRNQTPLLETFWAHVREEESLVFFYAKQVPLVDEIPGRRILVGVGRVKSVGPLTEYRYEGTLTDGRLRSM